MPASRPLMTFTLAAAMTAALVGGCASNAPEPDRGIVVSQTDRGVEITTSDSILFDSGAYQVRGKGAQLLDRVADLLRTRTRNKVLIEGHTDNVGSVEYNNDLSELRALTVMKELVDRGVPKERMSAQGYGMSRPVADNASDSGRRLNRRTVIIILGEKRENLGQNPFGEFMDRLKNLGNRLFR